MSAPILAVCGVAVLALSLPVISAAAALEIQQRSSAAADAAALAAADAMNGWIEGEPCVIAARVTAEFGVTLAECKLDFSSGEARVIITAPTFLGDARSRARAGPPRE